MATNASWQNFSELLLGGLQRGLSATRQQQGQKADLLLTLQNMLNQRAAQMRQDVRQGQAYDLDMSRFRADQTQNEFARNLALMQERRASALAESTAERNRALAAASKALAESRRTATQPKPSDKMPPSIYAAFYRSYDDMTKSYDAELAQYNMNRMFMRKEDVESYLPPTPPPPRGEWIKEQWKLYRDLVESGDISGLDLSSDDTLKEVFDLLGGVE